MNNKIVLYLLKYLKSKTVWWGIFTIILGLMSYEPTPRALEIMGIITILLRAVTNKSISDK